MAGCNPGNPFGLAQVAGLSPYPMFNGPYATSQMALLGRRFAPMTMPPSRERPPSAPVPPEAYPPGCVPPTYYPPGCSPCPPSPEMAAMQAAAYQLSCEAEMAQVRRAGRAQVLGNQPQIPLSFRTAAGVTVAAGATQSFPATPTIPLCITRLEIPRAIGQFFLVTSVRAARQELLADGAGVPGDSFSPDAINTPLIEFPFLYPGTPITITVENIDAAPHPFYGTYWGVPLQQPGPCL